MPTITVKNIPEDVYARLKKQAKANRRSINNEVITLIEREVSRYRIDPEEFIREARAIRELTADYILTDEELDRAINEGRS
ncbi:MAG: Arc family DNA-binding protein [Chloroflexi bacterium]|nr:Arc family DNA-binding protein [Chloroflexota bacterium]